jgi:hypothetical protein
MDAKLVLLEISNVFGSCECQFGVIRVPLTCRPRPLRSDSRPLANRRNGPQAAVSCHIATSSITPATVVATPVTSAIVTRVERSRIAENVTVTSG